MLWLGFEPTIPDSERAKRVHALDSSATVNGLHVLLLYNKWSSCHDSDNENARNTSSYPLFCIALHNFRSTKWRYIEKKKYTEEYYQFLAWEQRKLCNKEFYIPYPTSNIIRANEWKIMNLYFKTENMHTKNKKYLHYLGLRVTLWCRGHLEDLRVDGRTILWIWTRSIWFRLDYNGGFLWSRYWIFEYLK
jgi:hypothetical protein